MRGAVLSASLPPENLNTKPKHITMKKSLLIALFAAMPLMAQDCPQKPECAPQHPCCFGKMHRPHGPRPQLTEEQKAEMKARFEARRAEMLAKFDADKDGKLSEDERKAAHEARKTEMKAKFMEKFDTDKDGQISDAEKEAAKAEFGKRGPRHHGKCGHKGPRHHGKCCGHKGPRPQLTEEQKAEMKAKFEAHKAKFMEKFDTDKDGQISDAEKEAIKAEFGKCGPRRPHGPRHGKCCGPKCDKH